MTATDRDIQGPMMVVVSAPSGAGKTSICRKLLKQHKKVKMSVSATTRPKAKGERQGRDYFFMENEEFETKIGQDWFVEWAKVYDHYYGTPRSQVQKILSKDEVVLLDVDVQGGRAIMKAFPESVTIFILPPSLKELKRRLKMRGRDQAEEIDKRLRAALKEIKMRTKYDYTVINSDLDRAVAQVESILEAESLRSERFEESERGRMFRRRYELPET